MECPYCKIEMREGYVQGARGVFFSERERMIFFTPHKRLEKDIVIASQWGGCSAPAHYCDTCKCMIVKTEERESW